MEVAMHRLQVGKNSDSPAEPRRGLRARAKQSLTNFLHSKPAKAQSGAVRSRDGDNGDSFRSSASLDSQQSDPSSQRWERGRTGDTMEFDSTDETEHLDHLQSHTRSEHKASSYPEDFLCPISKMLMADPVLVASGTNYERRNFRAYLDLGHRECFKTGETLEHSNLTKNSVLKKAIDHWCDSHRIPKPTSPSEEAARDMVGRVCIADTSASSSTATGNYEIRPASEIASSSESSGGFSRDSGGEFYRTSNPGSVRPWASNNLRPQQIPEATPVNNNGLSGGDMSESSERYQNRERLLEARHHTWSGDKPRKPTPVLSAVTSLRRDAVAYSVDRIEGGTSAEETSTSPSSADHHAHTISGMGHQSQRAWGGRPRRDGSFPLPLTTTPSAFSEHVLPGGGSGSGRGAICVDGLSEIETSALIQKLQHKQIMEQEEAVVEVRKLTRLSVKNRLALCDLQFLEVLLPLLQSRYSNVQINAVATIMNLSLEKENKLKVARAGAIPSLVDVLKSGHQEAQEHAAGTLFSLAINDENKYAIGVLGAVPPLIHVLRTGTHGARRDAAMALYQLSFSQLNRSKLIKSGGVGIFLSIARDERTDVVSRALLILCNIAAMPEGRVALAELNAVQVMVGLLTRGDEEGAEQSRVNWAEVREHAAATLLQLSHHNVRFKSQAMQAGALEGLQRLVEEGTPRAREKAISLLTILRDAPRADDDTTDNNASVYRRAYVPSYRRGPADSDKADSAHF